MKLTITIEEKTTVTRTITVGDKTLTMTQTINTDVEQLAREVFGSAAQKFLGAPVDIVDTLGQPLRQKNKV